MIGWNTVISTARRGLRTWQFWKGLCIGASVTPMPALDTSLALTPDTAHSPRPTSFPPWQGLFFASHPLWVPCTKAGGLGSPGQGWKGE